MTTSRPRLGETIWNRVLRVPITVKVVGIATIMALAIGVGSGSWVRSQLRETLAQTLEHEAAAAAGALAARVEQPLLTHRPFEVHRALDSASSLWREVAYAAVVDREMRLVATYAPHGLPHDTLGKKHAEETTRRLGSEGRILFDVVAPILNGEAGFVRLALTDARLEAELTRFTGVFVLVLLGVGLAGLALAVALSRVLARPIRELLTTMERVRDGDLSVVAPVHWSDEVGLVAREVNSMLAGLRATQSRLLEESAWRRDLVERLITSQEEERARLARELHDGIGQTLSATLLAMRMAAKSRPECARLACGADRRMELLVDEVRRMAAGLRPSVLDDYGLSTALERLVSDMGRLSGVAMDLAVVGLEGGERLAGPLEVTLYRICQEALTNVVRHASASRASVVLSIRNHEARLVVEDDGCGTRVAEPGADRRGTGIASIHERARLASGRASIDSEPGIGTSVTVVIPLEPVARTVDSDVVSMGSEKRGGPDAEVDAGR